MLYYLSLKAAPMPRRVILEPLIDTFLQNQSAFYNILALQTLSPQYHNNNNNYSCKRTINNQFQLDVKLGHQRIYHKGRSANARLEGPSP